MSDIFISDDRKTVEKICEEAGFSTERKAALLDGLEEHPDIAEELAYYLEHRDFLCKVNVAGMTMVDVLIWQIDHFRAFLDRDTDLTKRNPAAMGVLAAETMLRLRRDPDNVLKEYSDDTGTDRIIG